MKKILGFFKLKKEAILLDSGLYIIKAFLAVIAAYFIVYKNPVLKLDIISVLFGLMLTLEPVNLTGVRNGLNQVYSTVLGAVSTALIIYFIGINVLSIALAVAFTLYVCLRIDWRAVSPVAIFTSIYMTQYVQKTVLGEPSIFLTFRLRIYALLTGVIMAIIFNFIFSKFYYNSMINKRIAFLLDNIITNLELTYNGILEHDMKKINDSRMSLPSCFNNIDWMFSLFQDIKKEYSVKSKIIDISIANMENLSNILLLLRTITHLNYDINYLLLDSNFSYESIDIDRERIIKDFDLIEYKLQRQLNIFNEGSFTNLKQYRVEFINDEDLVTTEEFYSRLIHDLKRIKNIICEIDNEIFKYSKNIKLKVRKSKA